MKNKLIRYAATALVLIFSASCSDFLDIKPLDKMVLEDYWKTQSDVESTVLACYRAMQEDGYMERIILAGELRSDNVIVDESKLSTPADIVHINDLTIKPTNGYLKWQDFYRVINYCNAVIEFAPGVAEIDPNYTAGFMRSHLAEATTIRALTYFYLVRIYRDVPYIDFHYKDDTQPMQIPQTSGKEILKKLVEQLETAERYALTSWGQNTVWQKGRVTKNFVRALEADIYLWLGEYDKCIAACERIEPDILGENDILNPELATGAELRFISNKTNALNALSLIFLGENSAESIFELQFDSYGQANNKLNSLYYGSSTGIGQLAAATFSSYDDGKFFDAKDVRGQSSFSPLSKSGSAQGFSKIVKYYSVMTLNDDGTVATTTSKNVDNNPPNWVLYRVADVYLMKAEALVERNQAGDLEKALELVNTTFLRSAPEGVQFLMDDYNSQAAMRKLVLDERQREFLFEGKRWFDLVRSALREDDRNGGPDNHPLTLNYIIRKYTYNGEVIRSKLIHTDALYLPIHSDELINNPTLVQNPYYEVNMSK
ncbi:MAG: RagB/SusD family nutrient uptake outer membrane protein [Dysgonamonadaceae bacterium]|jgi:hypothetical protein|nr:RagB/SusD family nutrient uptake outer membrane protein [Dysgonamonadaceae bacterium]